MSSNTFRVSWWVVRMVIILAFPQSVYSADTAVSSGNVEAQGPLPLERLVSGPGIWSRSPAEFESAFRAHGLQWLSHDKDRARFCGENLKLWDGTIQPAEIIVPHGATPPPGRRRRRGRRAGGCRAAAAAC